MGADEDPGAERAGRTHGERLLSRPLGDAARQGHGQAAASAFGGREREVEGGALADEGGHLGKPPAQQHQARADSAGAAERRLRARAQLDAGAQRSGEAYAAYEACGRERAAAAAISRNEPGSNHVVILGVQRAILQTAFFANFAFVYGCASSPDTAAVAQPSVGMYRLSASVFSLADSTMPAVPPMQRRHRARACRHRQINLCSIPK